MRLSVHGPLIFLVIGQKAHFLRLLIGHLFPHHVVEHLGQDFAGAVGHIFAGKGGIRQGGFISLSSFVAEDGAAVKLGHHLGFPGERGHFLTGKGREAFVSGGFLAGEIRQNFIFRFVRRKLGQQQIVFLNALLRLLQILCGAGQPRSAHIAQGASAQQGQYHHQRHQRKGNPLGLRGPVVLAFDFLFLRLFSVHNAASFP